jgi:dihydroxyacid dehydratase/phosphogluconate dehydratase
MLLATLHMSIPAIFISGGLITAGRTPDGEVIDLISVFEDVGAVSVGKIDEKRLTLLEKYTYPLCGSCSGMFTANSLNCLVDAIGWLYHSMALHWQRQRSAKGLEYHPLMGPVTNFSIWGSEREGARTLNQWLKRPLLYH